MLFNSYPFTLGFLPIFVVLFWAFTSLNMRRATMALLIVGSLFFYAWWDWHFLFLFGFSMIFNFGWSLLVAPDAQPGPADREKFRRRLLGLGIAVNLALLGYFKYRDFFLTTTAAGGNRKGNVRRQFNLFATMLLGGLWHGASWTFVVWGGLQGLYLSINHVWWDRRRKLPPPIAWAITFVCITASWAFFRALTFMRASQFFTGMAGLRGFSLGPFSYIKDWRLIAIGLLIVIFGPNRQEIMEWRWQNDWVYAGVFAALAGISVMAMSNPPPFIYFQF